MKQTRNELRRGERRSGASKRARQRSNGPKGGAGYPGAEGESEKA
jgi:hypothetical protein